MNHVAENTDSYVDFSMFGQWLEGQGSAMKKRQGDALELVTDEVKITSTMHSAFEAF